jgi:hypothetical protein
MGRPAGRAAGIRSDMPDAAVGGDTDVATLKIEYQVAGESAHCRLGGSTDAECLSAATSGRKATVC